MAEPTKDTPKTRRGFPPREQPKRSRMGRFFLRGMITVAPVVLTFVVFGLLYQLVDRYVTGPINSIIYWSLEGNSLGWRALRRLDIDPTARQYLDPSLLPVDLQDVALRLPGGYSDPRFMVELEKHRGEEDDFFPNLEALAIHSERLRADVQGVVHPVVGIALSLLLVLWLGWLVGGFVGRYLVLRLDKAMHLIPIVKSVYPYSKQLVEFFFAEKSLDFDTVVAVPYPSRHIWSIAFVTANSLRTLRSHTGKNLVSAFIPSSPMPMTGYTIFIETKEIIPLPITVDEALRITMSGGVLVPPHERIEGPLAEEFHAHLESKTADQDEAPGRRRKRKRPPTEEPVEPETAKDEA